VAAVCLMGLGIVDDLRGLSVRLRLFIYTMLCTTVTVYFLSPQLTGGAIAFVVLVILTVLAMLWFINLYNFMDGIDGITAIQSIVACSGAAVLSNGAGSDSDYALFCLLLAAAHCGFLVWNWPPARLFMGDAGSVSTGFLLAGLALLGAVQGQLNPLCWLVLLAVFIVDASWTLIWRIVTGQPFTQPHRLHAYQRLSRYWHSHLKVDFLFLVITVFWLLPIAWCVQKWPELWFILVIMAYLPLVIGMAKIHRFA
jgi:Fuc2NAc and GlcNAc transferase